MSSAIESNGTTSKLKTLIAVDKLFKSAFGIRKVVRRLYWQHCITIKGYDTCSISASYVGTSSPHGTHMTLQQHILLQNSIYVKASLFLLLT
jgi:hypothetical protein